MRHIHGGVIISTARRRFGHWPWGWGCFAGAHLCLAERRHSCCISLDGPAADTRDPTMLATGKVAYVLVAPHVSPQCSCANDRVPIGPSGGRLRASMYCAARTIAPNLQRVCRRPRPAGHIFMSVLLRRFISPPRWAGFIVPVAARRTRWHDVIKYYLGDCMCMHELLKKEISLVPNLGPTHTLHCLNGVGVPDHGRLWP